MRWAGLVVLLGLAGCVERLIEGQGATGGQSADGSVGEQTSTGPNVDDTGTTSTSFDPPPVELDRIYVNSSDALLTFDPVTGQLAQVGRFLLEDGGAASVTDIAVDRFGQLWAVSQGSLYVCDPQTVICSQRGVTSANSAGFAEFGALADDHEVLVVVEGSTVVQVHIGDDDDVQTVIAGTIDGYSSSGDIVALGGSLMLLSSPGPDGDLLVPIDASSGRVAGEVIPLPSLSYGLAVFAGQLWVFTDFGQIFRIDGNTAVEVAFADTRLWGAASHPDVR